MARDKTELTTVGAPTTPNLTEWGTPDWRDPDAYGDSEQWPFNRCRWEFYRRRDDLREHFDARAEETYLHWQKYAGKPGFPVAHLRPEEPGFCAIADVEARKRFGYSGIPNPRIGAQPAGVIRPWEQEGFVNYIESNQTAHNGFRGTFGELLAMAEITPTEEQMIFLRQAVECLPAPIEQNEMAITFNLNKPLEPQVKHAREMLRWHQSDLHRKPMQKRRHNTKWLGYLRVLDAREAGVIWAEITDTFYAQGLLNRHKSPSGGYCDPPPQAGRDMWKAANALRFNF
jgi:hypothetical protein